jgi:radical SAM protein with 4Fe4S-binding SPASM domain
MRIRPLQGYNEITINSDWEGYRGDRYHEYRRLWSELPRNLKLSGFPLHLDFETTSYCNLKCPMCPRTVAIASDEFGEKAMVSLDEFKDCIDQGAAAGLYSTKFNYMGEPLMHPDVVEQVRYCKEKGLVDVMFNTNAVLLTPQMSHDLLEAGIDKLFVSFDSPVAEVYEKVRVGAKFDKVVSNIRNFYKLKKEKYPHVQFRISMVLMEENEADRDLFVEMFSDTVDAIGFDEHRDTSDMSDKPRVDSFVCAQLYQRMFLRADGNVIVCCADEKMKYIVGNWKQTPLKDIWLGPKYTAIRKAHAEGRYFDIPMCRACTVPQAQELAFSHEGQFKG